MYCEALGQRFFSRRGLVLTCMEQPNSRRALTLAAADPCRCEDVLITA